MNIAFILDEFPRIQETSILNKIIKLEESGVSVGIFALKQSDSLKKHTDADILLGRTTFIAKIKYNSKTLLLKIFPILIFHPIRFIKSLFFLKYTRFKKSQQLFKHAIHISAEFRKKKIKYIKTFHDNDASELAMYISLLSGIPYSIVIQTNDIYSKSNLQEIKLQQAKHIISTNIFTCELLQNHYPKITEKKLFHISNGINTTDFNPGYKNNEHNGRLKIVTVGQLKEKKGFHILIEAMSLLDFPIQCNIIGEGEEKATLINLIKKYKLESQVTLTDSLTKHELQKEFQEADLFVLPAIISKNGDRDSIPKPINEALAMELPVISTKTIEMRELIKSGAGFIVEPNNIYELAERIRYFDKLPLQQKEYMGIYGRGLVIGHYNIQDEIKKIKSLMFTSLN